MCREIMQNTRKYAKPKVGTGEEEINRPSPVHCAKQTKKNSAAQLKRSTPKAFYCHADLKGESEHSVSSTFLNCHSTSSKSQPVGNNADGNACDHPNKASCKQSFAKRETKTSEKSAVHDARPRRQQQFVIIESSKLKQLLGEVTGPSASVLSTLPAEGEKYEVPELGSKNYSALSQTTIPSTVAKHDDSITTLKLENESNYASTYQLSQVATDSSQLHRSSVEILEGKTSDPCTTTETCLTTVLNENSVEFGHTPASTSHKMSLLEQKRLQWAAEKAQMSEWYPWGRPGGGAPVSMNSNDRRNNQPLNSNRQSDFENDQVQKDDPPSQVACILDDINKFSDRLPPLTNSMFASQMGNSNYTLSSKSTSATSQGNPTLRSESPDTWKGEMKKQWLRDLDKQREEQRVRKHQDKMYYQKNLMSDTQNEADPLNNLNSANSNIPPLETDTVYVNSFQPTLPTLDENENNVTVLTSVNNTTEANNTINNSQRSFLRGANIPLDPRTQSELMKKREKALEQQRQIQNQVEEKLKNKLQEKERQKLEELAEELRLAKERERIEQQYLKEQNKFKVKEKVDNNKKGDNFTVAFYNSKLAGESAKEGRRSSKLPDVLDGTTEELKQHEDKSVNEMPVRDKLDNLVSEDNLYNSTSKNSLNNLASKDNLRNSVTNHTSPYIHNRVLTPTKYRGRHSIMRDFATQTDSRNVDLFPLKKDRSTTMSFGDGDSDTMSTGTSTPNAKRRDRSKSRATKKRQNRKPANRKQRPKWGVNQPVRSYQSQSEKDIYSEWRTKHHSSKQLVDYGVTNNGNSAGREDRPTAAIAPEEIGRRRTSGRRTRSSAEHQRTIIAQEEAMALTSQRGCLSPLPAVRPTATGSSLTFDEACATPGQNSLARKPRRQWESPRRDEIPNFYTDSPHLPDVRNVRRGHHFHPHDPLGRQEVPPPSSSSNHRFSETAQVQSTGISDRSRRPSPFRSTSPPVPALRHKMEVGGARTFSPVLELGLTESPHKRQISSRTYIIQLETDGHKNKDEGIKSRSPSEERRRRPRAGALMPSSPQVLEGKSGSDTNRAAIGNLGPRRRADLVEAQFSETVHHRQQCGPSSTIQNSSKNRANTPQSSPASSLKANKVSKSTWLMGTPHPEQQSEILQKLMLIRQGLFLKQQEVDMMMANIVNHQIENQHKNGLK